MASCKKIKYYNMYESKFYMSHCLAMYSSPSPKRLLNERKHLIICIISELVSKASPIV